MWFAPIMSIIVNPSYKMTIHTKEKTKHGNNSNGNKWCINYLLANDLHKSQITSTRHIHQHDTSLKKLVPYLITGK